MVIKLHKFCFERDSKLKAWEFSYKRLDKQHNTLSSRFSFSPSPFVITLKGAFMPRKLLYNEYERDSLKRQLAPPGVRAVASWLSRS